MLPIRGLTAEPFWLTFSEGTLEYKVKKKFFFFFKIRNFFSDVFKISQARPGNSASITYKNIISVSIKMLIYTIKLRHGTSPR